MKKASLFLLALLPISSSSNFANDWPNYRGPNQNGVIAQSLPGTKASPLWKTKTDLGFSSFAVGSDKALTMVQRNVDGNSMEVCVAMDAKTGNEIWAKELWIAGQWNGGGDSGAKDNKGGDGPRSTPTVSGDKVYVIDSHIRVYCLELDSGKQLWKRDIIKQHSGNNIKWHNAASPVIDGDLLFVAGGGAGQALMALNKESGEVVWKAEDDLMTHASPVVAEIHGTRQVIFFTQKGLVSLSAGKGELLWRYEFPYKVSTAASPVVWKNIVYCSAGYGVGAGAAIVNKTDSGFSASELWRTPNDNINHWSTPVVLDGFLYGMYSFKKYGDGPLACVDIRTGQQKWSRGGFGPGNVILAGNQLVALTDKGEIVIARANPGSYEEVSRADLLDGKCWSHPAIANGVIYARSTVEGGAFRME